MSRRSVLMVAATLVSLYLCIIALVLAPMQSGVVTVGAGAGRSALARVRSPVWCRGLRWEEGGGRAPVALASFPGSGNTWLRYLLQQATGVVTGSIYLDYSLRSHGFPAENVSSGSVLVVKTHEPPLRDTARFRAAVLLLRNPHRAILADFNRLHKGHVGTAPRAAFSPDQGKLNWARHVSGAARGWEHFHTMWLREFKFPLHVVLYERLVQDTRSTLAALLAFLNHTVSDEAMECAMVNKEGIYRRRRRLRDFEPYTPELGARVERARDAVHRELSKYRQLHPNSGLEILN